MSTSSFTPKQRASLEKALNYCHGEIEPEMIRSLQDLIDNNKCDYLDCSIVCENVFMVAYGKRGLFVNHEEQALEKDWAKARLHDLLLKYQNV